MVFVLDVDSNRVFDDDYEQVKTFMNVLNNGYSPPPIVVSIPPQ